MTNIERFAEAILTPPQDASTKLALHLLDTLGAWYAGTRTEDALLALKLAAPQPGFPAASDTTLDRIAQRVAVIRNTEIDDIHMPSCTTIGSVVVPVAVTVAQALGKASAPKNNAGNFAQAIASGYEAMARLSLAISGATILYRGIWPTFFSGPVGAAATAAPLLGLTAEQTADAIGIALSLTSGAAGGGNARFVLLGQAARAGVWAALAAAKGYRGDRTLLDGDWLQRSHGIALDAAPLTAPVQGEGAIATISYKPFCAAKQNTAALDGFRQLLAKHPADSMEAVKVNVPPAYAGMIGQRHTKGRVERIINTSYQFALAAYHPELIDDVVRPDHSQDAKIAAFMPKVEIAPDPTLASYFPAVYPARIEATLKNGETESVLVTDALGDPARPLSDADVLAKFHRLTDPIIGAGAAESVAKAALGAVSEDASLASLLAAVEKTKALG
ncbi:MAG TPA: MmgE/PrpD family protein [Stellaceae bacterium]|nr:MmgE/PrpD family protein [Stellaceae bacterium]